MSDVMCTKTNTPITTDDLLLENKKLRQELSELKVISKEMAEAWTEHQQTKFKPDGSHFQSDVRINVALVKYKQWSESHGA